MYVVCISLYSRVQCVLNNASHTTHVETPVWKKPFEVNANDPTVSTSEQMTPPWSVFSRLVWVFSIVIKAST